jgi:hypothetical protein
MDRKLIGVVLFEWLQWSPQQQLLDVVGCSVVVAVLVVLALVVTEAAVVVRFVHAFVV